MSLMTVGEGLAETLAFLGAPDRLIATAGGRMPDMKDATYIHWPVHEVNPTAHVMGERLHRHFHANVTFHTDWNRGVTHMRIVAPTAAVVEAVHLYLGARDVEWTWTKEEL